MRVLYALVMTFLCLLPGIAHAQAAGERHVAMTLVPETRAPASGGRVTLALAAVPQPGWHGYWQNPGDAGVETTARWTLPAGVTAGPIRYPVPQPLLISGIMNHVYEGPWATFVDLSVPAGLAVGTRLPVSVVLDYLVCTDEICVPETAELSTVLTVGEGRIESDTAARFAGWRARMPRPLDQAGAYEIAGDRIRIAVPYPADAALERPHFFALTEGVVGYAAAQTIARDRDRVVIETAARSGRPAAIEGVLATGGGRGLSVRAVAGAVPPAAGGGDPAIWGTLFAALGGAILGGLILNVMPCVFPILSLKALSLAKSGGEGARGEALGYTAGVVSVCLALGGLLLALRAGGATVGWAFQLTDPRVIVVLLLLVTGIALNLAGLFEMAAPAAVNRAAAGGGGAFATGALAAFVATPCTGPFMGAAMGSALLLPWWGALAVFGGLGLGLALPFLAIGFVPALRRRLPRPGAWMETMRRILSLPMFLTAIALAWVLGRQAGVDGMTVGLFAALLLGAGLWWTGRRQAGGRMRAWLPGTIAAVAALACIAVVTRAPPAAAGVAGVAGHEPFSEARLAQLRAEGRPVFAYFTADWCVTCKVNERAVIETDAVQAALRDGNVAVLVGDWTDGDAVLGRFIERHDRAGVPLYLWYAPGAGAAEVLPQVLTSAILTTRAGRTRSG